MNAAIDRIDIMPDYGFLHLSIHVQIDTESCLPICAFGFWVSMPLEIVPPYSERHSKSCRSFAITILQRPCFLEMPISHCAID